MQTSVATGSEVNVGLLIEALAALNEHDTDRLLAMVKPGIVIHYAELAEPLVGRETWLRGFKTMGEAFPDFHVDVDDIVAAGDRVALRAHITGTHSGEFQGIAATGRRVCYVSHEFYRVADGAVAEEWICSDTASLFAQLQ